MSDLKTEAAWKLYAYDPRQGEVQAAVKAKIAFSVVLKDTVKEALYANLFDGQRGGRTTRDIDTLVDDAAGAIMYLLDHDSDEES